jgi:hypothetical protein
MSPGPSSAAEVSALGQKIDIGIRDIIDWGNKIMREINRWLPWLGPFASKVAAALDKFDELLRKIASEIGKFATRWGAPWGLSDAGEAWRNEVAKRAGDQSGKMTFEFMQAEDGTIWTGDGATAYLRMLPSQKAALEKIFTIATGIGNSLRNIANAIWIFWVAAGFAIVGLVLEFIPEAAASATPAAPAGIAAAVASALKFLAIWGTAAGLLLKYLMDLRKEFDALDALAIDGTAFSGPPDESWPVATSATDLNDGSVSDGDGSQWKLKQ